MQGLALPIDKVLFCLAKHSYLFMHLPGGLVLSVTKKEKGSFLPLDPVILIYQDKLISKSKQTCISFGNK